MPLQKSATSVPLFSGLETKIDSKLVPANRLLEAVNVSFVQEGAASMRYGSVRLPRDTTTNGTLAGGVSLSAPGQELLLQDGEQVYTYGETQQQWVARGPVLPLSLHKSWVVQNSTTKTYAVSAFNGTIAVYAWQDSSGVRYSIQDTATGATYADNLLLSATAIKPQLLYSGGYFCLAIADTATLEVQLYRAAAALPQNGFTLSNIITSALSADYLFAMTAGFDGLVFAWTLAGGVGSDFQVQSCSLSGQALAISTTVIGYPDLYAITVTAGTDASTQRWMLGVTGENGGTDFVEFWAGDFLGGTAFQTADLYAGVRVTACTEDDNHFWFAVDKASDGTTFGAVKFYRVDHGPNILTSSEFFGTQLASHIFLRDETPYVFTSTPAEQTLNAGDLSAQTTYFVQSADGTVHARFCAGTAGGPPAESILALPQLDSEGRALLGIRERFRFEDPVDNETKIFAICGVSSVILDFEDSSSSQAVPFGDLALVNASLPYSYDGGPIVESGFAAYPEDLAATVSDVGGSMEPGVYLYFAIYEAVDNKGRWHRSAPGFLSVNVPAGTSTNKVTLQVPYLPFTRWQALYGRDSCYLSVFRSPKDNNSTPTLANRITALNSIPNLTTGTYAYTLEDTAADTTIASGDFLYTSSGEFDNDCPAPFARVLEAKRRVFGISQENRLQVWYSKLLVADRPVEWSVAFTINVETTGGDLTALGELDEVLVLFKENRIYKVSGSGPNADGRGDNFSFPQLISTSEGCTDPASVLKTDQGLWFKGRRGWCLLTHGLGIEYVGTSVDRYKGDACTGAAVVPSQAQVRFVTDGALIPVFDYLGQRWSTYSGMTAVGCAMWRGQTFCWLDADGTVHQEVEGSYADDGAGVSMTLTTAWLKPAQMAQGFARAYEIAVLGTYLGPHTLAVDLGYDYDASWGYTLTFDPATALNTSTYGSDSPYGSAPYGGGSPDAIYQFRSRLPRQRCESIRFRFRVLQNDGVACQLNELALMFGVIGGLQRLPASKTV